MYLSIIHIPVFNIQFFIYFIYFSSKFTLLLPSRCNFYQFLYLRQGTDLFLNLLKPTGYVMHQKFNIQQLYVQPTLYLCVLCLSENKQRLVPLTA